MDWIVFGFIVICGICCLVFFVIMFIGLCGWIKDLYEDTHKEELEIFKIYKDENGKT
ncbi:MAG: hypothetical protein J6X18_07385 [Bacteroidales bacterium]|nr:hypothetical protein [Bacteroidales bacterium]